MKTYPQVPDPFFPHELTVPVEHDLAALIAEVRPIVDRGDSDEARELLDEAERLLPGCTSLPKLRALRARIDAAQRMAEGTDFVAQVSHRKDDLVMIIAGLFVAERRRELARKSRVERRRAEFRKARETA